MKANTDGTILEFLQGSHSYDGVWFGEPHPILKGQFWWRSILREYLASQPQPSQPKAEQQDTYVWVKASERLPDNDKLAYYGRFLNNGAKAIIQFYWNIDRTSVLFFSGRSGQCERNEVEWLDESPAQGREQDGWISVENSTPVVYHSGNFDGLRSDLVFTKNDKTGEYHIAQLYEGTLDGNHFKDWYDKDDFEIPTPTHYMEIPI